MIKVSCFKYEDEEDEQGQLIVMYVILVECIMTKKKHTMHKRYSDFLELFTSIRELSPEIDKFRFPNKSLFNNRSQFTLKRRLEGFNDLLQLAITIKPTPRVLSSFLDLNLLNDANTSIVDWTDSKGSKNGINVNYSYNSNNSSLSIIDTPNGSTIGKDEYSNNDDNDNIENNTINDNSNKINEIIKTKNTSDPQRGKTQSNRSNNRLVNKIPAIQKKSHLHKNPEEMSYVDKNIQNICFYSFILALLNYSISVLFGVVDITKTTRGKMVLTVLSIALLFCFIISFSIRAACFLYMRIGKNKGIKIKNDVDKSS
mmetsp:Transcript_26535/g.25395  ORF Transcript_26535/g.25395 Transcript_26535/m.25395 type:complete len:314 (+) Transcript_26535:148-1089(+)